MRKKKEIKEKGGKKETFRAQGALTILKSSARRSFFGFRLFDPTEIYTTHEWFTYKNIRMVERTKVPKK